MLAIAAGKNQVCTSFRQGAREVLAEAAAGSGDDGDTITEVERLAHSATAPGTSTTFIRFGSRRYKRSNHLGPSASAAIAVISGFTLIRPALINSIARGYSPAEAQDPCSRICRVTTFCRLIVASGAIFPTSTTLPPFRTLSIAAATVGFIPTASIATSTPAPPVSFAISFERLGPDWRTLLAPSSELSFSRVSSI